MGRTALSVPLNPRCWPCVLHLASIRPSLVSWQSPPLLYWCMACEFPPPKNYNRQSSRSWFAIHLLGRTCTHTGRVGWICIFAMPRAGTRKDLAWGPRSAWGFCRTWGPNWTWISRSRSRGSGRWISQLFKNQIRPGSRYGAKKDNDNQLFCARRPASRVAATTPRLRSNSPSSSSDQPH